MKNSRKDVNYLSTSGISIRIKNLGNFLKT